MSQRRFYKRLFFKAFFLIPLIVFSTQTIFAQNFNRLSFQDISKDSTFDVVTWNIEWFGSEEFGPEDLDLQMNNVIKFIDTIDADLYAFQEIEDKVRFFALRDSLEDYSGFFASYTQTQKTAYLFKESLVDSLDSGLLEAEQMETNWAGGRFPLFFEFDVTISNQILRVFSYNLHAKAFADQNSYNQRRNAANSLKEYLDRARPNASVLILGDFNDMLTSSTFEDEPSPYDIFVQDDFYLPLTKSLEEEGKASYLDEEFRSFIDHIIVTNVLKNIYLESSVQVAPINYIENFTTTTSDHAPVWSRFNFTQSFEDIYEELPEEFAVGPNYPNPFNPTTTIPFELDEPSEVTGRVYDIMGRQIAVLANQEEFPAGDHTLQFNASGLTSGIYILRIELNSGENRTQKITLIK